MVEQGISEGRKRTMSWMFRVGGEPHYSSSPFRSGSRRPSRGCHAPLYHPTMTTGSSLLPAPRPSPSLSAGEIYAGGRLLNATRSEGKPGRCGMTEPFPGEVMGRRLAGCPSRACRCRRSSLSFSSPHPRCHQPCNRAQATQISVHTKDSHGFDCSFLLP